MGASLHAQETHFRQGMWSMSANTRIDTPAQNPGAALSACPRCGGPISRIPRRFVDRIISMVRPVQRFRCRSFTCQWIGNIPARARTADPTDRTPL
jgi:hypothetical protein